MIILYCVVAIILFFWGLDRHLAVKDIQKDLIEFYEDFRVARDLSTGQIRVHYQATCDAVKRLIKKHFQLD